MKLKEIVNSLTEQKVLTEDRRSALGRIIDERPFSVYYEMRAGFYTGIILLAAGIGLTIKEYFHLLGHFAVIGALSLLFISGMVYAFRKACPYSDGRVESPNLFFDYAVYLACIFYSLDIAYIETHFRIFKSGWEHHFIISSLLFFFTAYRFDNRLVLTLALSSLAAWFGFQTKNIFSSFEDYHRLYALLYGGIVSLAGILLKYRKIKEHFFNTYLNFAANFLFIASVSGVFKYGMFSFYFLLLAALCAVSAGYSFRKKEFIYFLYAVIYGYFTLSRLVIDNLGPGISPGILFSYFIISSVIVIGIIFKVSGMFKEKK